MAKFGVGQSVRRVEDQRFITGPGRYTDDIDLAGQAYGSVLRSPAGPRPDHVDRHRGGQGGAGRARGDHRRRHRGRAAATRCRARSRWRTGTAARGANPLRPVLCTDRVRHVGDRVAFVVAETLAQAKDAAELISVEYESLPVVADTETAAAAGQPLVHDDVPDNLCFDWEFGDRPRSRPRSPRPPTSPSSS